MPRLIERNPETMATDVDGETFLVRPDREDIHYLDAVATGIWRLLSEPMSENDMSIVMRDAFPDVSPDVIEADLKRALEELMAAGHLRSRNEGAG